MTLLENAEDFLREAVHHARMATPRNWKYAILHLCSALELLFKAILEQEHWSLIFENVNEASRQKLYSGNFRSVRFDTAVKRLQGILGGPLTAKDVKYLETLRDRRNCLMHFSVNLNINQARSLVARGLNIFLDLRRSYLTSDRGLEYEINQTLQDFQNYVKQRLRSLSQELKDAERPHRLFTTCRHCAQETIVLRDDRAFCLFCGEEYSLDELAEIGEGRGGPCPQCEGGSLTFVLFNNEEGQFVCVRCGFEASHDHNISCAYCGTKFWSEDGFPICGDCWENLLEEG